MEGKLASAFLEEMAERPDDDGARLIYADWLDDHGEPQRAEFIRLQCGPGRDDPAVAHRAEELLRAHRAEWEAPFQVVGAEVHFRRGFPYFLKVGLRRLAEDPALLGLAPEWHIALKRGGSDPHTPEVEWCARLAKSRFAGRIRELNFTWGWCWPQELGAILVPAVARGVRELRFGDDDCKPELLDLLLHLPGLQLDVLAFYGDSSEGVGDEGCRLIAAAPQLASLRGLELPNNDIGPDGVAALASSAHLRGLTDLNLAGGSNTPNEIGPDGARHLARSDNFHHLASLDLVFNGIGDDGLAALAHSPRLGSLKSLNVPGNVVTDEGLRALARAPGLPSLDWLNVCGGPGITAAGIRELADSWRMARLTGLKLAGHRIGDAGAAALADAPGAGNLRELYVRDCGIGRDGLVRMLESANLSRVREFALGGNALTPGEVQELKARYGDRVK
jgi:uncharacterized protein (TIGR02996 family)